MSFSKKVKEELRGLPPGKEPKKITFLREAFLSYGNITDPKFGYHLEFHPHELKLAEKLISALESIKEFELSPNILWSRNEPVVYVKGSEKISDFLVFIGAKNQAMQFMQEKMLGEVRNNINRSTNFETANIKKTVNCSALQIKIIKEIKKLEIFEELPENLKEIANLRLSYPNISFKELGKKCKPKISRSGVNHRFNKIFEVYNKLSADPFFG